MEQILLSYDKNEIKFLTKYYVIQKIINSCKTNNDFRIYTDFETEYGPVDILYEDFISKTLYVFKIYNHSEELEKLKQYKSYLFKVKLVPIHLMGISKNISELKKQVGEIIEQSCSK